MKHAWVPPVADPNQAQHTAIRGRTHSYLFVIDGGKFHTEVLYLLK